jgi:hypothetical protein
MKTFNLMLCLSCLISQAVFSQTIKETEAVRLEISPVDFHNSKLNGLLTLQDVQYPGKEFEKLTKLGRTNKVVYTEVTGVGEEKNYVYGGVGLHYSALSQPELIIAGAYIERDSFLLFPDGKKLQVGKNVSDYVVLSDEFIKKHRDKEYILIYVTKWDVTKIVLSVKNLIIEEITIRF